MVSTTAGVHEIQVNLEMDHEIHFLRLWLIQAEQQQLQQNQVVVLIYL